MMLVLLKWNGQVTLRAVLEMFIYLCLFETADAKITVSVTLASVYEVKKTHSFTQRLQNMRIHILINFYV